MLQRKEISRIPPLKNIIPMVIPLLLMFYHIYPQALDVLGSSFILFSGVVGMAYYVYHGFPFKETITLLLGMGVVLLWFLTVAWMNNTDDPYTLGYFKSEIAWFFSSYLIVLFIFKVHKQPSVDTVLMYIVGAVALQCFITFIMYLNESIAEFFFSLQLQLQYTEDVVGENSWQRLMGYGIGFFGAGANNGIALVVISYLLIRKSLKTSEFLILSSLYVFIFYISLFMARTTVVGAGVGFALIAFLYFKDKNAQRKQIHKFLIASVFLLFGGYLFAMFYFEGLADWAFELFINFAQKGELQTRSSDGIKGMFEIPELTKVLLAGDGVMLFRGSDVGYTRMLYYVGVIGSVLFYGYAFFIVRMWGTKHSTIKILGYALCVYSLILNIKGWYDLNHILFVIFFYFMFYKYYVYYPKMLKQNKEQEKLKKEEKLAHT